MKKLITMFSITIAIWGFMYTCLASWSTEIDFSRDKCERIHYNILGEDLYRESCWAYELRSLDGKD